MIEIPISKDQMVIVDDCDADLQSYIWSAQWSPTILGYYAVRWTKGGRAARQRIQMHRIILARKLNRSLGRWDYVDHINHNPLDNRRSNLRLSTPSQNQWNRNKGGRGTSKFVGVSYCKGKGKWQSVIGHHGKKIYLGAFDDEIEAARAYDTAAQKLRGKFARLNFPEE